MTVKKPDKPKVAVKATTKPAFQPYLASVARDTLFIRSEPSDQSSVVATVYKRTTYTIVAESAGPGSVKGWGKLKSGSGWVSLDEMQFVRTERGGGEML